MTRANAVLSEASCALWDVLVIGGGPAGAVAARRTAEAGYRTLLVEKQPFPRSKVCGACVNGRAIKLLSLLGMDDYMSELPSMPFDAFELTFGKQRARIRLPVGKAIARRELDDALVRAAIQAGASWLPETLATVSDVADAGSWRTVLLTDVDQHRHVVRARLVLVADGLGSPSLQRREAEFPSIICEASRIGVGGICESSDSRLNDNAIHMTVSRHGYVGAVALADGTLNIAAALDVAFLKSQRDIGSAIHSILTETQKCSINLQDTEWKGTPRLTRKLRRSASTRVLVLGDAAGYVEPFTGEGIAWAITSGAAAALLVPQGISEWTEELEEKWVSRTRDLVHQHQTACRWMAKTLRSPRLASTATRILSVIPGLAAPIVNRSNAIPQHVEQFLRTPVLKAVTTPSLQDTREQLAPTGHRLETFKDEF